MAWIKVGDNAYTHPKLVACASVAGAPESAVREMFGWFLACSCYSASHYTDYRVDLYIARKEGGAASGWLIEAAQRTGLVKVREDDGITYLELVQDPEFVGIILKAEKDWNRQQQADTRNPALAVPVRLRDGDQCRYCSTVVSWMGKISPRRACFDHRDPTQGARTPEDLVVACFHCNSSRREHGAEWDRDHPLLPAPVAPIYGVSTAKFLTENGHPMEPNVSDPKRGQRGSSADTAPRQGVRPAAQHAATSSTGGATEESSLEGVSHSEGCGSRSAGSGRGGTGHQSGSGDTRGGLTPPVRGKAGGTPREPSTGRQQTRQNRRRGKRGGRRK